MRKIKISEEIIGVAALIAAILSLIVVLHFGEEIDNWQGLELSFEEAGHER